MNEDCQILNSKANELPMLMWLECILGTREIWLMRWLLLLLALAMHSFLSNCNLHDPGSGAEGTSASTGRFRLCVAKLIEKLVADQWKADLLPYSQGHYPHSTK